MVQYRVPYLPPADKISLLLSQFALLKVPPTLLNSLPALALPP